MTTALDHNVAIDPSGVLKACAWCLSRERLAELAQNYTVSHSLCTTCAAKLEGRGAA
jgi:hypothetical protein